MAKRGRPKRQLRVDILRLTDDEAQRSIVRYTFVDGTSDTLDAGFVKENLERQVLELRRIQGREGGRPSKITREIKGEILLLFGDFWLRHSEDIDFLTARAQARAWVVREIMDRHQQLSARTAARAVADALGRKTATAKRLKRN